MARPRKYKVEEMLPIIEKYTEDTEMPILKELCIRENWSYKRVYMIAKEPDYAGLAEAIEKLVCKKEVFLEKGLIHGHLKPAGAIFALKQLGWREEYMSDDQKKQISLNNKLIEINSQIAQEKLNILRGDTDLTQVNKILVEVKKIVDEVENTDDIQPIKTKKKVIPKKRGASKPKNPDTKAKTRIEKA